MDPCARQFPGSLGSTSRGYGLGDPCSHPDGVEYRTSFGDSRSRTSGPESSRRSAVDHGRLLGDLRGPRSQFYGEPLNAQGFGARSDDRFRPAAADPFRPPISMGGRRGAVDFGRPADPAYGPLHAEYGRGASAASFYSGASTGGSSTRDSNRYSGLGSRMNDPFASRGVTRFADAPCDSESRPTRIYDERVRSNPHGSAYPQFSVPRSAPGGLAKRHPG